jgi:hypothetical protein
MMLSDAIVTDWADRALHALDAGSIKSDPPPIVSLSLNVIFMKNANLKEHLVLFSILDVMIGLCENRRNSTAKKKPH